MVYDRVLCSSYGLTRPCYVDVSLLDFSNAYIWKQHHAIIGWSSSPRFGLTSWIFYTVFKVYILAVTLLSDNLICKSYVGSNCLECFNLGLYVVYQRAQKNNRLFESNNIESIMLLHNNNQYCFARIILVPVLFHIMYESHRNHNQFLSFFFNQFTTLYKVYGYVLININIYSKMYLILVNAAFM